MKYLILGAGPAGLTLANRLLQCGETSFLVLEKEHTVGGLCRSAEIDGSPLDIGGGHFLDVKNPKVLNFLFDFMPEEEWNLFERKSSIYIDNAYINHPFEANIWQLGVDAQIEYLISIAKAGCNCGIEMPQSFVDWINWKLGDKIAENYMLPYNRKMFGKDLNLLGTYWLEKLPNVSFEDTLRSCINKQAYGSQPGHAHFYYPKEYGYGEVWLRMGEKIRTYLECDKQVVRIDFSKKIVYTSDGRSYSADTIITTIPWVEIVDNSENVPDAIKNDIYSLRYTSVNISYYPENMNTDNHWIYYPDEDLAYHRILVRHNFCPSSRGYWTETNEDRMPLGIKDTKSSFDNKYAYPLNTIDKPNAMQRIAKYGSENGVIGLGRWGEHQHYNSDVTVDLALRLADKLVGM